MLALVLPFLIANWRAAALIGAVVAIVGAGALYRHALIAQGEATALEQVRQANDAAQQKADAAAANVAACAAGLSGYVWNRSNGMCEPAAR